MEQRAHALYKGLQRPLVFKFLRGRFIYWGLGSIVAGIVAGGIASAVLSSVAGLVTLIAVSLPLLMYTISKQKQGLHSKTRHRAVFMVLPRIKPKRHVGEEGL